MEASPADHLSGACTVCGRTHQADRLERLAELLDGCCRVAVLPTLPFRMVVPRGPLSQNRTTYAHWTVYRRDKVSWLNQLTVVAAPLVGLSLPFSRWSIHRQYSGRERAFDFANLVGGCKPIPDCLKKLSVIQDDSPGQFECQYTQSKGDQTLTVITLVSIDG